MGSGSLTLGTLPTMATEQQGALLWEPPEELRERATMTRYMRWLESERGLEFDDYAALWRWSTEDLEAFWGSIWEFFDVQGSYDEVLADASMPGAKWFTGAEISYPEHIFRDRPGDRVAIRHASELRDARGVDVGRAARADRPHRRRPEGDGRRARGPRRRLHAEHPRDDRRLPRHREPRRRLVELLAGLRGALASSTASRRSSRRCC